MSLRFLVLHACVFVASCQVLAPEENDAGLLEVHLQSAFEQTPVRIELDSQVIFDSLATTNHIAGLAERVATRTSSGAHILEVLIDNEHRSTQQVILGPALYVGIQYRSGGEITVQYSKSAFSYF